MLFASFKRRWGNFLFKRKWRQANRHNYTHVKQAFHMDLVQVGIMTYGQINVFQSNEYNRVSIGHYCSIADEVCFLVSADHEPKRISTYPFKAKCLTGEMEALSKGDIVVEDDVWIGYGATILSGVRIGQGAVVAAGAVVTKDIPPYAIVAGVPAKVIKYRFEPELIHQLMRIDYSKLDKELIRGHIDELYQTLDSVDQLGWMPKFVDCAEGIVTDKE